VAQSRRGGIGGQGYKMLDGKSQLRARAGKKKGFDGREKPCGQTVRRGSDACYLEARPESGYIWKSYKQKLGTKNNQQGR